MSEFRIDLRLPVNVLRETPFAYVGPDFRSLPLGVFSDIVTHRGRQRQRLYPFTVSKAEGDRASADLLFCFIFFYINDEDELVVFLTHPINLGGFEDSRALEALLAEVEKLAEFLGSHLVEIEIHGQVAGHVAFPTSLSFYSYDLKRASALSDAALFKRRGFHEEAEVICFDQSIMSSSGD